MKKALFLSALWIVMSFTYAQNVDNLLAYYPLNGSADDISSFNNHGIVKGTKATKDRFGNDDCALYFDGINDFIQIPHNESLNFDVNKDCYTICFWVKSEESTRTDNIGEACIITKSNDYMYSPYPFNVYGAPGILTFDIRDKGAASNPNTNITDKALNNNWNHVALIVTPKNISIFINGRLREIKPVSFMENTKCSNDILIGTDFFNTSYFKGALDDIRLYGSALKPDKIFSIYNYNEYDLVKHNLPKNQNENAVAMHETKLDNERYTLQQ